MRLAAAMRIKAKFAAKAVSFSVRSKIQRASVSSRYVLSVAATTPSMGVGASINGTSTADSASTHTGAPAITSSCTALSRRSDPHERSSTTSVSVLGTIRSSPRRSTRTMPEVVCGTKASRTVSTKKREAVESR